MEETTVIVLATCHDRSWEYARRTLSDQAVQVDVIGALKPEVATADIVDGLVVDHEGAVGVLQGGVGGQDRVVRLNDGDGRLRSRVDTELQLALLAVVDGQALHQQSTETRAGTTAKGVEDQEALEAGTGVGNAADLVENAIDKLLSNGVVATGIVVGSILLAGDHVLGVEQASVWAGADLVDDVRLKIAVDCSWDVLSLTYVHPARQIEFVGRNGTAAESRVPVSEKKVLKPWSGSAALRSSVRYPSGCIVITRQLGPAREV